MKPLPTSPLFLIALTGPMLAQSLAWTPTAAGVPARWISQHMTYDPAHDQFVVFGGATYPGPDLNDTWVFDRTTWALRQPVTQPPARHGTTLAFDPRRNEVLMFGGMLGNASAPLADDTWAWDGTNWTQLSPLQSPGARSESAMVTDTRRGRIVLCGGWGGGPAPSAQGVITPFDTWVWDGAANTWTEIHTAHRPGPRSDPGMAYDAHRDRVVLFGGDNAGQKLDDTWEFDGSDWQQINTSNRPPARAQCNLTHVPTLGGVLVYGGHGVTPGVRFGDTWLFDGVDWREIVTTGSSGSPTPRDGAGMAYDPITQSLLVVDGRPADFTYLSDTWWLGCAPHAPANSSVVESGCHGSNGRSPWLSTNRLPTLGGRMVLSLDDAAPGTVSYLFLGFTPVAADLTAYGAPGCAVSAGNMIMRPILTNASGSWSPRPWFSIPNSTGFLGLPFRTQVGVWDPGANALQMAFSNALLVRVGGHVDAVRVQGNSMWNSKVYISWQNITHVYESGPDNMVVDSIKFDDDGDGDPRNNADRVLLNGQTNGAFGLITTIGAVDAPVPHGRPGVTASVTLAPDGSGTLTLTRTTSVGVAEAHYSIKPSQAVVEATLHMSATAPWEFNWGIGMLSNVSVVTSPGQMALIDSCCVNGNVLQAQGWTTSNPSMLGVDYLEAPNQVHGYAGLASSPLSNALGFALAHSAIPVTVRAEVVMNSIYGGWSFSRAAYVFGRDIPAGDYVIRGILTGDNVASFQGIANDARLFRR